MSEYICRECKEELVVTRVSTIIEKGVKLVSYKCSGCGRIIEDNVEDLTEEDIKRSEKANKLFKDYISNTNEDSVEVEENDEIDDNINYVEMINNDEESIEEYVEKGYYNKTYCITKEQIADLLNGKLIAMCALGGRETIMIKFDDK